MKTEKNYDFRFRHFCVHKPGRRDPERTVKEKETLLDASWRLGCSPGASSMVKRAVDDLQDYFSKSMDLSLTITGEKGAKTLWIEEDPSLEALSFLLEVTHDSITVRAVDGKHALRSMVYMEDVMNLEGAPLLPQGAVKRKSLYRNLAVHSGCGIDEFPNEELNGILHAGYNCIDIFLKDIDTTTMGHCNINDIILRAKEYGISTAFHNYIRCYQHPDDPGAQERFDKVYGEIFKRYPDAVSIGMVGESLEFPSKDPATSGKRYLDSIVDGIPDTRPSPGWSPCKDYPAYLQCIEKAIHKAKPDARMIFSTYNWGWAPLELRKQFLDNFPKNVDLSVCFEIFSQRKLEGLSTPVMDYTISAEDPGYYFKSEAEEAHKRGIRVQGNVNTAGIAWDFGCVPLVPVPYRWLKRSKHLREACKNWGVDTHYCTHHYGWWASIASDIVKWSSWEDFEPDYEELFRKVAARDYGKDAVESVMEAWKIWSEAMGYYIASNEDQYGPWRVGAAYPFIFHPNITRTMTNKEIKFPTPPHAHFGYKIIKTFYQPYENCNQSPGFLRYPAEIRSLEKMLALWNKGLEKAAEAVSLSPEGAKKEEAMRLEALGHFIRNSVRTVIHIKRWWQENVRLVNCATAQEALQVMDKLEALAEEEIENVKDTIPAVELDSRLGWEPSMEYVCDKWHLEWKLRQMEQAKREMAEYRATLLF